MMIYLNTHAALEQLRQKETKHKNLDNKSSIRAVKCKIYHNLKIYHLKTSVAHFFLSYLMQEYIFDLFFFCFNMFLLTVG